MTIGKNIPVADSLQDLFEVGWLGALSDGQLLHRFVVRREEPVFQAIIERHGPMVWGVCRRVLRHHHDAEDAFQATFLVLARKASSVADREKLGNWLYGVAHQTALKARSTRAKRRRRETQVPDRPEPTVAAGGPLDTSTELIDLELSRLPDRYRVPIVLCELEGKSHRDVAEELGWPIGTVSGRLSRARTMLAKRLTRRGVSLSAGALAVLLARESASASVPARLINSTAQAAGQFAAGGAATAGLKSASAVALTREVLRAMLLARIKVGVMVIVVAIIAGAGGVWRASRAATAAQEPGESKPVTPSKDSAHNASERLQGVWTGVVAELGGRPPSPSANVPLPVARIRVRGEELILRGLAYGNIVAYALSMDNKFLVKLAKKGDANTIDLTLPATPDDIAPTTYLGIYRLDGDDLTVCLNIPNKKRPAEFKTKERTMELLLKLQRDTTGEWQETPTPVLLKRQPGDDRQ
jgi:RNA polymerase sigma-70 factor (ECF subfamily)